MFSEIEVRTAEDQGPRNKAQDSVSTDLCSVTSLCYLLSKHLATEPLYSPCCHLLNFLLSSLSFVSLRIFYLAWNPSLSFYGFDAEQQRTLSTVVEVFGKILLSLWKSWKIFVEGGVFFLQNIWVFSWNFQKPLSLKKTPVETHWARYRKKAAKREFSVDFWQILWFLVF